MGRKKSTSEYEENIDACLAGVMDNAKDRFGADRIFTGTESEARLVGIYMPALALRYLYQCNILPLSRMEQIVGTQESCKSAFLYEKYRWIRCNGGKSYHIENESKDSDVLRMSIVNYDRNAVELMISEALEDWQSYLTFLLRDNEAGSVKRLLVGNKENPGPGKIFPIGFGVDSLTAKASKETQDAMDKRGFADRAHPIDALKISSYLKCMPQKLVNWPFWFGAINHLKPQKSAGGATLYNVPGGYSVKFQETFETRMARVKDIPSVEAPGVIIKFTTQKNSLGPGRKSIEADFRWFFDPNTGRQHSYWDWNSATITLLDAQLKGSLRSNVHDIVDLHTSTAGGKRVWSRALGISKDDPVPYAMAGAILETKPELIAALHKLLGVREYSLFKAGVDYAQQLSEATVGVEVAGGYAPEFRDGEEIPTDDDVATDTEE